MIHLCRVFFAAFFTFLVGNSSAVMAQHFPPVEVPEGYFRNPLSIPISLSGNFGELRTNHFHMGIDFRTEQRENLRVYAAAEGYVARVKIEPGGFGRAIYINHPNGLTTLYAHLNDFYPELETYVKEQQYLKESWAVYLDIPAGMFPVKKGQFIAFSGNTGGSQGPHVHFEIRETATDRCINPMLFGLPIPDKVAPVLLRLSVYDRNRSVYEQNPTIIALRRSGNTYSTTPAVLTVNSSRISFAISAYDTHSGSSNQNGIYQAVLFQNNLPQIGFRMDKIGYEETRYLNAHVDYKTRASGGPWLQHLSELPGYVNSIYYPFEGNGILDISDGKVHEIRIEVKDAHNNTAIVKTKVQYKAVTKTSSVIAGKMFYPFMLDVYESQDLEFFIGEKCLYDSVRIAHSRKDVKVNNVVSAAHTIGSTTIPLQEYFSVRIKPLVDLPEELKGKVVMQRFAGTKKQVAKVEWQGEWAMARFRDFGTFQLVVDTTPPVIIPVGFKDGANLSAVKRIVFQASDNMGQYKNFRAELNPHQDSQPGQWLRFTNDKGKNFIYEFDEKCPKGNHVLRVSIEDEAGNVTVRDFRFTR
ncbi:MAG TPA: M23 family metallopeptidase [Parasegetibacter sp.]